MPSFQYRDVAPSFESTRFQYPSFQPHDQLGHVWIPTDPSLTRLQYEYELQQKYDQNAQEAFAFQQSIANTRHLQGFQQTIGISPFSHHTGWTPNDGFRNMRYNSPNGHCEGTLSASSSEQGFSPQYRQSSRAVSSCSQLFVLAPVPTDYHLNHQNLWPNDNDLMGSLPSPPDSTTTTTSTQAIALRELEFSCDAEYYPEQYMRECDTIKVEPTLPMHTPEELELTDSIAALSTSTRTSTLLSPASAEDDSDLDERDRDSDPDFNPRQLTAARRIPHLSPRTPNQSRSPRQHVSLQSCPVQDPKSRVQKPSRRSTSHGKKERRKSKSLIRPTPVKSHSSGSINQAPKYFPCTFHAFGCPKEFANKNEWKRHVSSQHLQLGFFRCDLGDCNPDNVARPNSSTENRHRRKSCTVKSEERMISYNDFNRKDLFTQHCRRMHGPDRYTTDSTTSTNQKITERANRVAANMTSKSKTPKPVITKEDHADFEIELDNIRQRCWQIRRKAPARSCCGFCNKVFQVEPKSRCDDSRDEDGKAEERAWEERMEHIGKHYERDNLQARYEGVDDDLEEWGLHVGILEQFTDVKGNKQTWLSGCGPPADETTTAMNDSVDASPRRGGLRSRGRRSESSIKIEESVKEEEYIKEEDEEKYHDDGDSEDDASGEDE